MATEVAAADAVAVEAMVEAAVVTVAVVADDVVVWGAPESRSDITKLRELSVGRSDRHHVRLSDVADVRIEPTPTVIRHEGISPYVDVTAGVRGRDLGSVAKDVENRLEKVQFPLEHNPKLLGEYAERQEVERRILGIGIVAPGADDDPAHAAASGRKQGRMPAEQSLVGQRLREALRRIEHHLDDALDLAIGCHAAGHLDAQPPGDGGTHLVAIEVLAFDLAGLQDVQRQRPQLRLFLKREAKPFHPAQEAALPVPDVCQACGQSLLVPSEMGPVGPLVNVPVAYYTHVVRIISPDGHAFKHKRRIISVE